MPLTNSQIDSILQEYDDIRYDNHLEHDRRVEKIYNELPAILEIDNTIASESIKRARLALGGQTDALAGLEQDNLLLAQKKERILLQAGYPADYLQPIYDCPLCRDTGYVDGRYCSCLKKRISENALKLANLSNAVGDASFDDFRTDYYSDAPADRDSILGITPRENILRVLDTAHRFIDDFESVPSNLLIYGYTGVGKTFLSGCIAKELIMSGHSVLYYTTHNFYKYLEQCTFGDDLNEEALSEDYIYSCDLLIIDDLGTELTNSFTASVLYSVINERSLNGLHTIISTNLSLEQLEDRYSERIFSRLTKDYRFVKIFGSDIRCM